MILRDAELVGWIIYREQGIECAVKLPLACVTNVSDFHGRSGIEWKKIPKGMSVLRKGDYQPLAKYVVVSHWGKHSAIGSDGGRYGGTTRVHFHP